MSTIVDAMYERQEKALGNIIFFIQDAITAHSVTFRRRSLLLDLFQALKIVLLLATKHAVLRLSRSNSQAL